MNIEPVNTQQAFLRLSLPIVFDNTELLKCIAGQVTIQEITFFFVLFLVHRHLFLQRNLVVEKLIRRNKSLGLFLLV